ncbi:hypothetical protein [Roseovarius aestuariivivens]|uniref:sulfotransferase-like domain-containing protein n=1 Tax=Roseovarius aestuariivivens TaxID=1888910 RepID=UPI0010809C9C|nr:hypothetical protein [Roseovarius aestuariivivens]
MHKILALWAHPRSMSTATERVMRERGDLACLHEPFMYDYYVGHGRDFPGFEPAKDHPTDYAGIRAMLRQAAEKGPVFFKDMAFYVVPRMLDDPVFMAEITHTFLVRSPMASILSYHKLDPDFGLEEVGIEAQWRLYDAARNAGLSPVVIEAESVRADPKGTMRAYWNAVGLDYREAAFDWQAPPKDWEHVSAWHEEASTSSGIRTADAEEMLRKEMEFEALVERAPHLQAYLDHHAPFYAKLSEAALWPGEEGR